MCDELKSVSPVLLFSCPFSQRPVGLRNTKRSSSYFPLSPVELGSCCSAVVKPKNLLPFAGANSDQGVEYRHQSGLWKAIPWHWGVQKMGGKGCWGVRMLELGCCAAPFCLQAPRGCSHNSVQSSDLNYTPTPRAV